MSSPGEVEVQLMRADRPPEAELVTSSAEVEP